MNNSYDFQTMEPLNKSLIGVCEETKMKQNQEQKAKEGLILPKNLGLEGEVVSSQSLESITGIPLDEMQAETPTKPKNQHTSSPSSSSLLSSGIPSSVGKRESTPWKEPLHIPWDQREKIEFRQPVVVPPKQSNPKFLLVGLIVLLVLLSIGIGFGFIKTLGQ